MDKQLYPLTQSQALMFFEMDLIPYKGIVNICEEFEFRSEIDKNLMMQALNLAMMRNPNNYVRLVKQENKQIMQYFTDESLDKIEYLEFTSEDEYQKSLKKFNCTPFPNKHIGTQLVRIRFVKKPNGLYAINGCFSHVIYDAYSIMQLMADICSIYKALLHGTPFPEQTYSPIKAYEDDYKYFESDRRKADEEYMRNELFGTEPQYTTINGKGDKSYIKGKKYGKFGFNLKMSPGMLNIPIAKEYNDAVVKYAEENKITAETVYMLASRTFLAHVCDVDDVLINNVIGRRNTVAQKKAGGSMADGSFVRTIFGLDETFNDSLKKTYAAIMDCYKHANYGAQAGLDITHEKYNCPKSGVYYTMLLTYQMGSIEDDEIKYTFTRLDNGHEISNFYLSVMPCDSEGNYFANYAYQADFIKEEKVREFHDFMIKFIEEGMKDGTKSVKEIIEKIGK